jgi:hypothetical protein
VQFYPCFWQEMDQTTDLGRLYDRMVSKDEVDKVLVTASRCLVADCIKGLCQAEDALECLYRDGSISSAIAASFNMNVDQFIQNIVLVPGRDAEDVILVIASQAYHNRVCAWLLDERMAEGLKLVAGDGVEDGSVVRDSRAVHLVLRGNHYDLFYSEKVRGCTAVAGRVLLTDTYEPTHTNMLT